MTYGNELYHHGIKGQRWGVRKYQNEDGSLTIAGYQHYGLNPDGSKYKSTGFHKKQYSEETASTSRKGAAGGAAVGAALGALAGPTGALIGANLGLMVGGVGGVGVGAYRTAKTQRKIRQLLKETGTVYVKDL